MKRQFPCQLTENLYVLGENLFLTYLLKGDTCALLDLGASGTAPLIVEQLRYLGVRAGQVEHLVVQHAHWDHVGALPYLRQAFPEATVLGSAKALEVLGKPKIVNQFRQNDELWCSRLKENGTFQQLPAFLHYETLPVDRVVEDGETVVLGGIPARFLATPGHSPCSLSVLLETERAALVSDAIGFYLPESDGVLPMFFQSVKMTLASIETVERLDIDLLCYGHALDLLVSGRENIARACRRLREETSGLTTRLKRLAEKGAPEEQLLGELRRLSYRDFLAELYLPEYLKGVAPFLLKAILAADLAPAT
jgi:glyoxylase-like metal-dependent hydrolase (beta-lactamase superfamily II)